MHSETYPITVDVGRKWYKFDTLPYGATSRKTLSFLYIGDRDDTLKYFFPHFESGSFADDFAEAQLIIEKFNRNEVPDAIIVDLSLNKADFSHFCTFLKEKNFIGKTVVIYNKKRLDAAKVKFLQQNELVDDVIDIQSDEINYFDKVQFLKKVKSRQNGLSVSRSGELEETTHSGGSIVKRAIDIILASIVILAFLPVFLLVAIAIRLESRGPVIYTSQRAGRGFKIFKFYKFRTMVVDADKKIQQLAHLNQYGSGGNANFLKINNDPRITRLGRILRKTSLDELPQLFNVLKGDMSLVGNRPLPLYEASTLTTNECVERFMAPAGITGLWQIKKRGKDAMSAEERISLDISYARKANVAYDLWIMAKTPTSMFQKSNV